MTDESVYWTARGIIALNWLAILLVFAVPGVARSHALIVFGVFRVCAILGLVYLVYECILVSRERATAGGTVADVFLVLPMFLFWFIVRAATF